MLSALLGLGRFVRNRMKVRRAAAMRGGAREREMTVKVKVSRVAADYDTPVCYGAAACIGSREMEPPTKPGAAARQGCAIGHGRTPQAAVAKALVSLGGEVARRGRVKR